MPWTQPVAMRGASAATRLAQAQPAQAPATPPSPAQAAADEPIGNVATLTGTATVIRNKATLALKLKDDIFLNDVLQTSANSTLGITFNDATTFNLTANATITVDNYVYEDGGKAEQRAVRYRQGHGGLRCGRGRPYRRHEDIDADRNPRHPRHHRPCRGAGRRLRNRRQQCRDQALSRRRRQGRPDRGQRPRRRAARLSDPGLERLYDQARRRRTLRRVAAGDLAAAGAARPGHRAPGSRRAERRPPGRDGAAHSAAAKSEPAWAQRQPAAATRPAQAKWPAQTERSAEAERLAETERLAEAERLPKQPGLPKQNGLPKQPGLQPSPPAPGAPQPPALPNRQGGQLQQPPGLQRQSVGPGGPRPGLQNRPLLQPRRPLLPAPKGKPKRERR